MPAWKPPIYRKSYKKRYGSKCFLEPKTNKYPICSHGKINAKGLNAAQYYLHFQKPSRKKQQLTRKIKQYRKMLQATEAKL